MSDLPINVIAARMTVARWLKEERKNYADVKYAEDGDNRLKLIEIMRDEGWHPTWLNFTYNYLDRARLFGAETFQGRQALGKAIVTLLHTLETAVQVHGPMPEPGVSSGTIRDWT